MPLASPRSSPLADRPPAEIKARIQAFYDRLSPHFRALWGPHLHDGFYASGAASKEEAQEALVDALCERLELSGTERVLDVGCGMGATSLALARRGCEVLGITLSPVQVAIARELAEAEGLSERVAFEVRDADALLLDAPRDLLWMVGVLGHLPDPGRFVDRAPQLLAPGGRFLLADWMAGPNLTPELRRSLVNPVLEGMLMPTIFSEQEAADWLTQAGFRVCQRIDFTEETLPTWDEGVSIVRPGAVTRLALSLGRDALLLLRAIRGMRLAMRQRAIEYRVLVAELPGA